MYEKALKRVFDVVMASLILVITSPILLLSIISVWLYDRHFPLYVPDRVGKHFEPFKMIKLRTMGMGADKNKVDTTSANDKRITPVGKLFRRLKVDELFQFINVLNGTMSIVGPRPNIDREVQLYTNEERRLLDVKPGITDFSSIVFSDLAEIVVNEPDANIAYNQLVRPWKSRLGLFYIQNISLKNDSLLIFYTAVAIVSRRKALMGAARLLAKLGADPKLVSIARREERLEPWPPPGGKNIVTSR